MSALLESLAAASHGGLRQRAELDAIVRDGLPAARNEAWKYTSLRALERRRFALPSGDAQPPVDAALLAGIPAPRVVFVNGRFSDALSQLASLPAGVSLRPRGGLGATSGSVPDTTAPLADDPRLRAAAVFARLGHALADDGFLLEVAAGTRVELPLHVACIGAPAGDDQAWHLSHRVVVGAGASVTLVEYQLASGGHAHLANAITSVTVDADAVLAHVRVQDEAAAASVFLRTSASVDTRASYRRLDLEVGAALSRHELNVRLVGQGAELVANGVLPADGRRHLDTRLGIEHLAPDTRCELLWRGVADGRGRAVFHGGITIHAGADGSDASLSNKNLLLSAEAEVDTQPVLVIHADEVKAAHGATVGQLDATALFYLRSRGLAEAEARRLLTTAFVREPLSVVEEPALRGRLEALLDRARLAADR